MNDNEFVFAYFSYNDSSPGTDNPLSWMSYNIETGIEITSQSPINYDDTFWQRNNISIRASQPELLGYFSPSGRYVIYNIYYGSVFDDESRTEIWVSETNGSERFKVFDFGYSNVYISQVAWLENESKIIFNASYEGPSIFYLINLDTKKTNPLADSINYDLASEWGWKLSPNGKILAVLDTSGYLMLVSLDTGEILKVDQNGTFPTWSKDEKLLYYWWGNEFDQSELRVFDLETKTKSTILDKESFTRGFHPYEGDNSCLAEAYYLGVPYAVSPGGEKILLWGGWMYLIIIK